MRRSRWEAWASAEERRLRQLHCKNADSIDFPSIELRGPFGPHVGSVEFETASIVTAEGTVNEDVKPD